VCEEHVEQHLRDVQHAQDCHSETLNEMVATQERQLSDQSEVMKAWSCDQGELVEQVSIRVNKFLIEELKDDLPTGLSILPFIFSLGLARNHIVGKFCRQLHLSLATSRDNVA